MLTGSLDPWTLRLFFGLFYGPFLGPYFGTFFFFGLFLRPLVIRKGWNVFYQYLERGGRQTVVTEGGMEDELLVRKEGWEVDVLVIAID